MQIRVNDLGIGCGFKKLIFVKSNTSPTMDWGKCNKLTGGVITFTTPEESW